MIDLNIKAEQQVAADNIQKKPRRIVTMKSGNNQAMVILCANTSFPMEKSSCPQKR